MPVSYSVIAEVAEDMERAHREGRSALPAIAEGLDTMRDVERDHRASLVAHRRKVFSNGDNGAMSGFAIIAGLLAIGATLAGFGSGNPGWFYIAGFLVALAGALFSPVIFSLRNR